MARISVCIPTYNGARYVGDALGSVLAQTYEDFELIVCDDASNDETVSVAATFRDERLRIVTNPQRLGLVGNWNRCLDLAGGEYITIFHQDDLMEPTNLVEKVVALEKNPAAGFVYSDINRIDQNGTIVGGHWTKQPEEDTKFSGDEFFGVVSANGNPVSCPSVIVRRECYDRLGYYDARLPFAVDLEMWLRIAKQYEVAFVAKPLILQRTHLKQETSRFQGTGHDYLDVLRAFDIAFDNPTASPYSALRSKAYRTLSRQAIAMARYKFRGGHLDNGLTYLKVAFLAAWHSFPYYRPLTIEPDWKN